MTIERNVTVKLNVPRGREGKAFEDAAKSAAKVKTEVGKASQAVSGMITEMQRSAASEKELSRVTRQLTKMGVEAGRARTAAGQLLKQVGNDARVSEQEVRRLGEAMRRLGTTGPAAAGGSSKYLSALGPLASIGFVASALQVGGQSVSRAYATSADAAINELIRGDDPVFFAANQTKRTLPVFGPLFGAYDDVRTRDARRQLEKSNRAVDTSRQRFARQRQLRALRQATGIERLGARDELFAARFGDETEAGVRGLGAAGPLDVEQFRLRRAREFQRGLLGRAQADLRDARTTSVATGKGVNPQQEADALRRIVDARRKILEIERRQLELADRRSQARRDELKTLKDQAKTQEESYKAIAEAERQRVQNLRERFGGLGPMERRRLLQVSRSIAGGGRLTPDQEDAILRNRDFFGGRAQQILGGRADQGGFGELVRNLGLDERGRRAQQQAAQAAQLQVQLENKIAAEINVNARNLAEAMAAEIEPQLKQLQADLAKQIQARLDRALHELAIQQGALSGP